MRSAPSVTYPVGRSVFSALLRAVLWVAGTAAILGWIATARVDGVRTAVALACLVVVGAWAAWSWRREPQGVLGWDGARWTFVTNGSEQAGQLRAALDWQSVLLVRWTSGASGWLWLDRSADPARWDALRRAVHSPASSEAAAGAEPPGALP
jgi:toxin CptA